MSVKTEYLLCVSADIEDLPPAVQEKLFDEVLDRDVQKGKDVFMFISVICMFPHSDLEDCTGLFWTSQHWQSVSCLLQMLLKFNRVYRQHF